MVDASRALTNRGEDGCKGCTMQSGHDEHRLGRHFGLLYSRRVTWQENQTSPWPSKIGIVIMLSTRLIITSISLLRRRIFSFFVVFFSFLAFFLSSPLKNSTSTFGSSSASPFFASVLSGILRGFYGFRSRWLLLGLWFLVWSFLPAVLLGLWLFFSQ